MLRGRVLLLGLLAAAATGSVVRAEEAVKDEPYPEAFRRRVTRAVDRGVEWILSKQTSTGGWDVREMREQPLGVSALCTLACLKGGLKASDPAMKRAFSFLRTLRMDRTYGVGVLLMVIHAAYAGNEDDPILGEPDRYGNRPAADAAKEPCLASMTPEDKAWMKKGVDFLLKNRDQGHWGYPFAKGPLARWDLSNTQYAMLGLWAASRCGFEIPPETWLEMLEGTLAIQERTGPSVRLLLSEVRGGYHVAWNEEARARGFRYRPEPESPAPTGAMTTAGAACLAICQDELWSSRRFTPELRARTRKGLRDALAWLQDKFDVTQNPGEVGGGWHHYYLYGLERAGILSRSRFVGSHDWYLEGATFLLDRQDSAGAWTSSDVLTDTCFAVLFLRRSVQRTRNPAITAPDR